MFSPKLYFLEMELLRLEQEYQAAADADRRRIVAEQIMMNLDTLQELEAAGKRSKKIDAREWMARYAITGLPAVVEAAGSPPPGSSTRTTAPILPVHADNLEQQIEAIALEPFDPRNYQGKKGRIEALMTSLIRARESSTAEGMTELLTKLWEVAVREDDAFETHQRTTSRQ